MDRQAQGARCPDRRRLAERRLRTGPRQPCDLQHPRRGAQPRRPRPEFASARRRPPGRRPRRHPDGEFLGIPVAGKLPGEDRLPRRRHRSHRGRRRRTPPEFAFVDNGDFTRAQGDVRAREHRRHHRPLSGLAAGRRSRAARRSRVRISMEPTTRACRGRGGCRRSRRELRGIFLAEARAEIGNLRRGLPRWRLQPDDVERAVPLRRAFHTLKGSGRLVGATALGDFSARLEQVLLRVIDGTLAPRADVIDVVTRAVASLARTRRRVRRRAQRRPPRCGGRAGGRAHRRGQCGTPTGQRTTRRRKVAAATAAGAPPAR